MSATRRDAALAAAGYEVQRFSWSQVVHAPDTVVAALRARLYGPSEAASPFAARRGPVSL